jgi:hypothetical protein
VYITHDDTIDINFDSLIKLKASLCLEIEETITLSLILMQAIPFSLAQLFQKGSTDDDSTSSGSEGIGQSSGGDASISGGFVLKLKLTWKF